MTTELDAMRKALVEDILDNDTDTIRRAVVEYVEGYTDETVREMYKEISR